MSQLLGSIYSLAAWPSILYEGTLRCLGSIQSAPFLQRDIGFQVSFKARYVELS
jgi:hypothetical protein